MQNLNVVYKFHFTVLNVSKINVLHCVFKFFKAPVEKSLKCMKQSCDEWHETQEKLERHLLLAHQMRLLGKLDRFLTLFSCPIILSSVTPLGGPYCLSYSHIIILAFYNHCWSLRCRLSLVADIVILYRLQGWVFCRVA